MLTSYLEVPNPKEVRLSPLSWNSSSYSSS